MAPLRITEIFRSLQGEGFHAGKPAVFVRGAGCNLACDFCDTDFSLKEKMSPEEIADRVAVLGDGTRFVVFTGGEPTIQPDGFRRLAELLRIRGYFTAMETNGMSQDTLGVDWVTVSPKLNHGGDWKLRRGQELKLIYEGQDLRFFEDSEFDHYFLQPKEIRTGSFGAGERDVPATRREWERTSAAVLANPRWRLSFQLHKELGLR
jgi:7-carboxy-7-deazaguanine synthase